MLGICQRGFFTGQIFDVQPGRDGAWLHFGCEHISGLTKDDFDFDFGHVADALLEHKYLGTYIPDEVLIKVMERIPSNYEHRDLIKKDVRFIIDNNRFRLPDDLLKLNELYSKTFLIGPAK